MDENNTYGRKFDESEVKMMYTCLEFLLCSIRFGLCGRGQDWSAITMSVSNEAHP